MTKTAKADNRKKGVALREKGGEYRVAAAPRIDESFAEGIAKLVAKGLNEGEAVAKLGNGRIKADSWYGWKQDHKDRYSQTLIRIRGERVNRLLAEIEAASEGDASRGIRHDWRAADRLLAISAPERFAKAAQDAPQPASLTITIADSLVRQIYGDASNPVIDVTPASPMLTSPDTAMQASPDAVSNLDTASHDAPVPQPVTDKAASGNASDSIVIDKD